MKKSLFVLFISMITCMHLSAEFLQGRIMQNDSTPCAFATVYIPSLNRGTSANQNGDYFLDELPAGKLKVEYSCIGQQSVHRELDIVAGQPLTNNEKLEEAVVMLPPSIITPNGESPSHYVLRHVWEQAEK
ncbi:MAG: carboxypeptidase-like regulatory domain-containing protein, partial [Bacteroidales bacterium]|nr:carboxypeptidase-like regulatory domain-containing protein [Bacteroidales bacterium]